MNVVVDPNKGDDAMKSGESAAVCSAAARMCRIVVYSVNTHTLTGGRIIHTSLTVFPLSFSRESLLISHRGERVVTRAAERGRSFIRVTVTGRRTTRFVEGQVSALCPRGRRLGHAF